jgi:hypothetical protein
MEVSKKTPKLGTAKLGTVGADVWLNKNPYNRGKGLKKHLKEEKARPKKIKRHQKERMMNGYSWYDWINFDSYIGPVIASAVLKFATDGVGFWPMDDEQMNEDYSYDDSVCENFHATCGAIYFALTEWANWDLVKAVEGAPSPQDAYAMETVVYNEAREAMHIFAENLGTWWD